MKYQVPLRCKKFPVWSPSGRMSPQCTAGAGRKGCLSYLPAAQAQNVGANGCAICAKRRESAAGPQAGGNSEILAAPPPAAVRANYLPGPGGCISADCLWGPSRRRCWS